MDGHSASGTESNPDLRHALCISPAAFAALRAHGEQTYPDECCGALLGSRSAPGRLLVAETLKAANARADSLRNRYGIAPTELVQMEASARRQGLEIVGFYHSHPDQAAQGSATDLDEAHWLGCAYVITEVALGKAAATNAFLLAGTVEEDKRFERMLIELG